MAWESESLDCSLSSSSLMGLSEPLWSLDEVSDGGGGLTRPKGEEYPARGERPLGRGEWNGAADVHTVIGLYAPELRISGFGMTGMGKLS